MLLNLLSTKLLCRITKPNLLKLATYYKKPNMSGTIRSKQPIRMWIDGVCYTIRESRQPTSATESCMTSKKFVLDTYDTGKFSTTFQLPMTYCIQLHSFPNFNIKQLETETNTEITIPQNGNEGSITISGCNESEIIQARDIIQTMVFKIREKQPAAQFLAIPVHTEEVQTNFEKFKQSILSDSTIEGMDESIFQSSLKLHLTICVFALMNDSEKNEAISTLNNCKTKLIDLVLKTTGPLKIKIAGIECMNNNFSKVNILYANARIENDDVVLQKLVNEIADYFYEQGLVRQYQDHVKLHVTLINTKYRKSSAKASPYKKRSKWNLRKQTFDATKIMELYKDYYFGESLLDTIHLSYMTSIGDDGFYKPLSIIKL